MRHQDERCHQPSSERLYRSEIENLNCMCPGRNLKAYMELLRGENKECFGVCMHETALTYIVSFNLSSCHNLVKNLSSCGESGSATLHYVIGVTPYLFILTEK